jgi:hypothetical protein
MINKWLTKLPPDREHAARLEFWFRGGKVVLAVRSLDSLAAGEANVRRPFKVAGT